MDEAGARHWLEFTFDVSRETIERLDSFVDLLARENLAQNLVSRASLEHVWVRHIADSAQLLLQAPSPSASWLDLGSGAGFPGLIVALLHQGPVTLVEQRSKRAQFLREAADLLALRPDRVEIAQSRVETLKSPAFDVISARAFAPLDRLLALGERFATPNTRWVLPKGKNAKSELAAAQSSWQGDFRLAASLTDDDSAIIVADRVRRRAKGKH